MTRYLLFGLIAVAFGNAGPIAAQSLEKYVPKVLIEGKWGEEPGEFGFRLWEGEPDYPKNLVVDSKENIYVLDYLNNRI